MYNNLFGMSCEAKYKNVHSIVPLCANKGRLSMSEYFIWMNIWCTIVFRHRMLDYLNFVENKKVYERSNSKWLLCIANNILSFLCVAVFLKNFPPSCTAPCHTHTTEKRQTFLPCQDFSLFCLMLQELVRIAFSVYHAKKYSKFSLLSGFHLPRL